MFSLGETNDLYKNPEEARNSPSLVLSLLSHDHSLMRFMLNRLLSLGGLKPILISSLRVDNSNEGFFHIESAVRRPQKER